MSGTDLLTLPEVAQRVRVSVSTVRHWIRTGTLPSVRPARRRLVPRDAVEAFVRRDITVERKS
jgi:excisionase family DNA binding protein